MADVFISYSRKDKKFVGRLHEALMEHEHDTWVDWEGIPPTAEWLKEIKLAIEAANTFAFIISPNSIDSEVCKLEVDHAVTQHKRLVPIVLRDVDAKAVPQALAARNWIFFREGDDFNSAFETLIKAIETDLDWIKLHTRLLIRSQEWETKGRENSFLLRGQDLQDAEEWLAQAAEKEPKPTALQTQYIPASRKASTKRQRIIVAGIAFGLVVAIVLAVVAFFQRQSALENERLAISQQKIAEKERDRAEAQRKIALARQLASQSELVLSQDESNIGQGLALSAESLRAKPTREGFRAWRDATHLLLRRPAQPIPSDGEVGAVAFGPKGELLATAGHGLRLWEVKTRKLVSPTLGGNGIRALAFDPKRRWIAGGGSDRRVRVWDLSSWEEIANPIKTPGVVRSLTFSHDGGTMAIAATESMVQIVDTTNWQVQKRLETGSRAMGVAFEPDRAPLLAVATVREVSLWDVTSGKKLMGVPNKGGTPNAVAFGPFRQRIVAAVGDGVGLLLISDVMVLNVQGGLREWNWEREVVETSQPWMRSFRSLTDVTFSGRGDLLAVAEKRGIAHLGTPNEGEVARGLHKASLLSVALSFDGQHLATADGQAWLWDDLDPKPEMARLHLERPVKQLAASSTGPWISTATDDGALHIFHAPNPNELEWKEVYREIGLGAIGRLIFSPGGEWLVAAGDRVRVMEVESWKTVLDEELPLSASGLGFSSDGRRMVIANHRTPGGIIILFDTSSWLQLATIILEEDEQVDSVRLGPDRKYLAAFIFQYRTPATRIWDLTKDSKVLTEERGPSSLLEKATDWMALPLVDPDVITPDHLFRVQSRGGEIQLIDPTSGQHLTSLEHGAIVNDLVVTSDGRWILSAGEDGLIKVWPVQPHDIVIHACEHLARNLTRKEWNQYVGSNEPYRLTCSALREPEA